MDKARAQEQALIWLTALTLALIGFKVAQRAYPEPFALARAQVAVEARGLRWAASAQRGPVQLAGFGLPAGFGAPVHREDLLQRVDSGLH